MRSVILVLCLLLFYATSHPTALQLPEIQGDPIAKIPFIYDGVHIIIRATLDNHKEPLNFIFDTGAEVNVLNLTWKKTYKITPMRSGDLSGSGNGMKVLPVTEFKSLHFGKAILVNQQFYLENLKDLGNHKMHIDGIVGYHLLASYIVKIDYNDRIIELYRTGRFEYGTYGFLMKMRMNNFTPVIRAGVAIRAGDTLTGWYQITTGGDYGILFNYPYVEKNHLAPPQLLTGRDSVDDLLADRQFIDFKLPVFMIGNKMIEQVDASFCPDVNDNDATRDIAGDIGNGIFRHFNIILNYGEREIFLIPNGRK
jgi:hypothetical protein